MAGPLCVKCGAKLSQFLLDQGAEYHVNCATGAAASPFSRSEDPNGLSHLEVDVRDAMTEIIQWGSKQGRSAQMSVGPSEIGTPCDRELGYRMAGLKGPHRSDPWPSIVGTATHTWMSDTVRAFEKAHGLKRLESELRVKPDAIMEGSTDLWWPEHELVLDFKFPGTEGMKKLREEGFGVRYNVQLNTYGLGHEKAGRKVSKVGIVALHRAGWLKDMWVKIEDYDRSVAEAAIARMYRIGNQVIKGGVLEDPSLWGTIEASPSRLCGYCPMYRAGKPADDKGCPGR